MMEKAAPFDGRMTYGKSFLDRYGSSALKYDETRPCAKCGAHNSATRSYEVNSEYDAATKMMTRTCARCGYKWLETPKDG